MIVDKKALELSENRQITYGPEGVSTATISPDGKRVAYLSIKDNTISLCLARANGTSATAVISSPYYLFPEDRPAEGETWLFEPQIAWSPDSKHIAIPAAKNIWNPTSKTEQICVLILASNGAHEATLTAPHQYSEIQTPVFSPNSRKLAVIVNGHPQGQYEYAVVIYDVPQSSGQVIYSQPVTAVELDNWDSDGQSIRAFIYDKSGYHHQRIWLNGQPNDTITDKHNSNPVSPDGTLRISQEKPSIVVENVLTGNSATVVNGTELSAVSWTPDNRMFLCKKQEKISDKASNRIRTLNTLWLANVKSTKMNTMCVALDYDSKVKPTWSTDCTKMAYTCNGRLYVAELNWREPNIKEKFAAGIATEEEEKELLRANAKEIGIGLQMYTNDWDGAYPDEAKVIEALTPYLRAGDLFYKPGTDQLIFKYIPPGVKESEIYDFSNTIIGELDLGRSWKVVFYTDTHARVVDK